jgi:hypothetical protein
MGGHVKLPPSKTMTSEPICWCVSFNFSGNTQQMRKMDVSFCSFFLARRDRQWSTLVDSAAHWVRSDVLVLDLEKTWTHEWGVPGQDRRGEESWSSSVSAQLAVVWQLQPEETVNWVDRLQWTLSLLFEALTEMRPLTSFFLFFRSLRLPCSEMRRNIKSLH